MRISLLGNELPPCSKLRGITRTRRGISQKRHSRIFLSGVQFRIRLDSRLKHAGMTVFGKKTNLTQQAAGNMTRSDLTIMFKTSKNLRRIKNLNHSHTSEKFHNVEHRTGNVELIYLAQHVRGVRA